MDLANVVREHDASGAAVTITAKPLRLDQAEGLGLMRINENLEITEFVEKPTDPEVIKGLAVGQSVRDKMHDPGSDDYCLASMGIYVFNAKTLIDALATDTTDFGKEIIPGLLGKEKMCSYVFDEYWEDIGTVKAFFDTNLSLTDALPPFNFFDEDAKIYTRARLLPASKLNSCNVDRAVVADGCIVTNGTLTRCSLGVRSVVHNGAELENVIMMGADSYETADDLEENVAAARPDIGVGEGSVVRHAILDKNVRIGKHVVLDPTGLPDRFGEGIDLAIRDGVLVVCKNVVVPDGFVLNA